MKTRAFVCEKTKQKYDWIENQFIYSIAIDNLYPSKNVTMMVIILLYSPTYSIGLYYMATNQNIAVVASQNNLFNIQSYNWLSDKDNF